MSGKRVGQRDDAGGDDVEQVGDRQVGDQPVVDGAQQAIAREHRQREPVERQRQSADDRDHRRHSVVVDGPRRRRRRRR